MMEQAYINLLTLCKARSDWRVGASGGNRAFWRTRSFSKKSTNEGENRAFESTNEGENRAFEWLILVI